MGKTAVLLLGLFTGLVSLTLQAISLGTEYWFEATVRNRSLIRDYYNDTVLELHQIPVLPEKRGLFSYCGYHYEANTSSTHVPSPSSVNFQGGFSPSDVLVKCVTYNFTQKPYPDLPGVGYYRTLYYLDRSAAGLGCIMLGLQLCGVLTSWQAAWTVITVLFTDCGTMFMFGSFMGLTSLLLIIASYQYEINERPNILPQYPEGYVLDYSWSFYLSWASLGLCIASGIMFLMVARQWHLEEVWFKKSLEEEKKRLPQQRYSRSKLIPSF